MTRIASCSLVLFAMVCLGCTSKAGEGRAPQARTGPQAAATAQESLTDQVPDSAVAALIVRRHSLSFVRSYLDDDQAMRTELSGFLVQRLGVDVTRIEGVAVFLTAIAEKPTGAVVLRLSGTGALKGVKVGQFAGVDLLRVDDDLVAASIPAGLVLGDQAGVQAEIALIKGQGRPLSASSKLASLLSGPSKDADVLAGVDVTSIQEPSVQAQAQQYGVGTVTLTYISGGKLAVWAKGDPAKLAAARDLIKQLLQKTLTEAQTRKDQAKQGGDTWEAASLIAAYHQLRRLSTEAEPRLTGDELRMNYQVPTMEGQDMMMGTAMVGILAAVAVPAYIKYAAKAKAAEIH